jgi:hypothetical protein
MHLDCDEKGVLMIPMKLKLQQMTSPFFSGLYQTDDIISNHNYIESQQLDQQHR